MKYNEHRKKGAMIKGVYTKPYSSRKLGRKYTICRCQAISGGVIVLSVQSTRSKVRGDK